MLMLGAIFIPAAYFHFITTLINRHTEKSMKQLISFAYLLAGIFAILNFTPLMIIDVRSRLKFPFWPTAGSAYKYFLMYFGGYAIYGCYLLLREAKYASGIKRNQFIYIFIGSLIGYLGGSTNFPLWYDIKLYPVGNILSSIYVALVGYAIVKYRLMDIKVAVARVAIFAFVYLFVISIPFFIAPGLLNTSFWWFPIASMGILASAGPFIYNYLRRRAEDVILTNQRRYQEVLRRLSGTITLVKDLERLLKLVVLRVARAAKVNFACIYLADESQNRFIQKAPYTTLGLFPSLPTQISYDSELIFYIRARGKPFFAEELTANLKKEFNLRYGLIIPSFVRGRLLGFLVLGPKSSGAVYTQEDVAIFGILANQLALAIENTQFISESQRTQAQLFSAERMASMGTMAGGMTHQINNRFHAIALVTSDTRDTLKFIDTNSCPQEVKDYLGEISHALLRIQENAKHGGKIVNDFLDFSQPDRIQKESKVFNLPEPLERGIEMVRIKTAFSPETIEKDIQEGLLRIRGDFVLIQDVHFNLIDNAIDALNRRRKAIENKELPEPEGGYKPRIIVRMFKQNNHTITQISDNGIGMTEDQLKKLFVPFFTTKATSVKGTGLGLWVIWQIIEVHGGTIGVESEYGKGTTFTIKLPACLQVAREGNHGSP
jgi:signal transduction histidine kinase